MQYLKLIKVIKVQILENRSKIIAGSPIGKSGFRDGDAASSLFNNIKSVIYFCKNETLAK